MTMIDNCVLYGLYSMITFDILALINTAPNGNRKREIVLRSLFVFI
jgi:hypothetical protein